MDGLPANCNKVANAVNKGLAKSLEIVGNMVAAFNAGFIPQVQAQVVQEKPMPGNPEGLAVVDVLDYVAVPGGQSGFTQTPQDPRHIVPLGNLQKGLEDLLKKGDCGAFVQKLLDKANELYGGGQPHATSFWDAFSRILDAGGYQFDSVPSNGGTVTGELFVGELANPSLPEIAYFGPGTVHMQAFGPIGRDARPTEVANAQARYAFRALHETLHLAKRGWYFDEDLARAGHAVDGTTAPDYKKGDYLKWSGNFDTVLQRHCPYPFE